MTRRVGCVDPVCFCHDDAVWDDPLRYFCEWCGCCRDAEPAERERNLLAGMHDGGPRDEEPPHECDDWDCIKRRIPDATCDSEDD